MYVHAFNFSLLSIFLHVIVDYADVIWFFDQTFYYCDHDKTVQKSGGQPGRT